ncbi:MAG: gamma-glutamyltransferase [Pseudomonadota bacterium]|nr:gamma-glutamyltransferase [Pseudomonadota bacterium]
MRRLPILLACMGLSACAPGEDATFNASEEARRAAEAADAARMAGTEQDPAETAAPEAWTKGAMVAAADPRAVEAGLDMLRQGGSAVDAAIAVHAVLGLVEPQSSGIGGGAFMVYYDHARDEITVFDGRETAPASTTPDHFMKDGQPLGFLEAWQSGKAVGVPGQIALYKTSHDAAGKLDWDALFQPAIQLAEEGFEVSPRLANLLANPRLRGATRLDDLPASSAYFYPDGEPLPVGFLRTNPDYADTLKAIAASGPSAFYEGEVAEAIVNAVNGDASPGNMTLEDLSAYSVKLRPALCGKRADDYRICSAPPPSSGGVTQNMIMGLYDLLEPTDEAEMTEEAYLKAYVDAQRLAYADRDHYVADADFVPVPSKDLIDPAYLRVRATEAFAPDGASFPGDPGLALGRDPMRPLWGEDATEHAPGTTHISIIDSDGNAVSMTATVEAAFGTSIMVKGFLLNNQMTDFSRQPTKGTKPVANAPGPLKRPRSSMSPTLVFDPEGDLFMVTGSPGGNSIIAYVSKTLVGVLEWGKTAQEAINLPNIIARGDTVGVEIDVPGGPQAAEALREMGYEVQEREGENSGLHVIVVREDGLEGGADPRREGVARTLD